MPQSLSCPGRLADGAPVIRSGLLVVEENVDSLHHEILAASAGAAGAVVVDMTATARWDRTGLAAIVWLRNWLQSRGSDLHPIAAGSLAHELTVVAQDLDRQWRIENYRENITVHARNGYSVITVRELDVANAGILHHALMSAGQAGPVIVDMAGTHFCDSTGMLPIVWIGEWLQECGSDVRVVATGMPRRVMDITEDDLVLAVFDSMEEAVQGLPLYRPAALAAA